MSTAKKPTRTVILEAARRCFERAGQATVRLVDVAAEAGVSRQAVYLNFESRAGLLLALVAHVDEEHDFQRLQVAMKQAATGREALRGFIEGWAEYLPHIDRIASAVHALRSHDEDATLAWRDRMDRFATLCRYLIRRIERDGDLAEGWSVPQASDLLWSMLSIRTWQDLTHERGWSTRRYADAMTRGSERTFVRSDPARGQGEKDERA